MDPLTGEGTGRKSSCDSRSLPSIVHGQRQAFGARFRGARANAQGPAGPVSVTPHLRIAHSHRALTRASRDWKCKSMGVTRKTLQGI